MFIKQILAQVLMIVCAMSASGSFLQRPHLPLETDGLEANGLHGTNGKEKQYLDPINPAPEQHKIWGNAYDHISQNRILKKLMKDYIPEEPSKVLDIKRNWKHNHKKWNELCETSNSIFETYKDVERELHYNVIFSLDESKAVHGIQLSLLHKLQDKLEGFEKMRAFEILDFSPNSPLQNPGHQKAEEFLQETISFVTHYLESLNVPEFVFVDDQDVVKAFKEHNSFLKVASLFNIMNLEKRLGVDLSSGFLELTEQWFWTLDFAFFGVLDGEVNLRIDIECLIAYFNFYSHGYHHLLSTEELNAFNERFDYPLKMLTQSPAISNLERNPEASRHEAFPIHRNEGMKDSPGKVHSGDDERHSLWTTADEPEELEGARMIVDQIFKIHLGRELGRAIEPNMVLISRALCEILDLIDRKIFPGILQEALGHFAEIEDIYILLLLSSRIQYCHKMCISTEQFMEQSSDKALQSSFKQRIASFHVHYRNQMKYLQDEFDKTYFRISQQEPGDSSPSIVLARLQDYLSKMLRNTLPPTPIKTDK
ncbi:hypothetical protein PtA15_10A644 [Puccinia triticina]|uniref:Exocyst complex component Sec8 n=1 Tax=Puccinia triticina TaxID=208348 RepID=A0ABY7CX46_9BASI|nr:uncharacterized protein PtA15_10A644 [Puccinia triticina]WAQ89220.1 hypothetical protein PtA15_10A644 [Puccinia triticina]